MMNGDTPVWEDTCSYSSSYSSDVNRNVFVIEGKPDGMDVESQQSGGTGCVSRLTTREYPVASATKTQMSAKPQGYKVLALFGVLLIVAIAMTFAISSSSAYHIDEQDEQSHDASSSSYYDASTEYDALPVILDMLETSVPSQMPSAKLPTENFGSTTTSSLMQAMSGIALSSAPTTAPVTAALTSAPTSTTPFQQNNVDESNLFGQELSTEEACWDDVSDWACCLFSDWC